MNILLSIAFAGAVGSALRYILGQGAQRVLHIAFPLGTLLVNTAGCLLAGVLARHYLNDETAPVLRAALIVGFCGGFTTFSTFSLETVALVQSGEWRTAAVYVLATNALCLLATAAGYQLVLQK